MYTKMTGSAVLVLKAQGGGLNTNVHKNDRFNGACAEGLGWRTQHKRTKKKCLLY